jgi:predicted N-acetyltransferase YhbS
MNTAIQLRSSDMADRAAILGVVRDAFTADGHDGQEEVDIVEAVWRLGVAADHLDVVAILRGVIAGHVLGSWGHLGGRQVIGIAPLSVSPRYQRMGVGLALMSELIRRADELPLVVLLGNPKYYHRFGFEPAGPLGITYPPAGPDSPHFQVRRLSSYAPEFQGEYTYAWEA